MIYTALNSVLESVGCGVHEQYWALTATGAEPESIRPPPPRTQRTIGHLAVVETVVALRRAQGAIL